MEENKKGSLICSDTYTFTPDNEGPRREKKFEAIANKQELGERPKKGNGRGWRWIYENGVE